MSKEEFFRSLREFHGPEKFSELRHISIFGKRIDLFKFYETAKRLGGSAEAVILTRWLDICIEIGAINPGRIVSLEEAHKASKYFCDCFHNFEYPSSLQHNTTRYGRKTKPKPFPTNYDIPYKNIDNYRSKKTVISDNNLLWMAKNIVTGPKFKFFSNKNNKSASENHIFDSQWVLPSNDTSIPLPFKIQSKVACAAKLATELSSVPVDDFSGVSLRGSDSEPESEHSYIKPGGKRYRKEIVKDIIYETSKFLISGHELELCLLILLKALIISSLPDVPGLCKHLTEITLRFTQKICNFKDINTQRDTLSILDLSCNILILIARDSFINFAKSGDDQLTLYDQSTLCLGSLKKTTCTLFLLIHNSLLNETVVNHELKITKNYNQPTNKCRCNGLNLDTKHECNITNYLSPKNYFTTFTTEEDRLDRQFYEVCILNYTEILTSILLLVKYLTEISTDIWQFELICDFIDPVLSTLFKSVVDDQAPDYWLWGPFQDVLFTFFMTCYQLSKKMGDKMQIGTVSSLYMLSIPILKTERISNKLFRSIVQMILNFHNIFDFHTFQFMDNTIIKSCEIFCEAAFRYSSTSPKLGLNRTNKSETAEPTYYTDPENTLFNKEVIQYLDSFYRRKKMNESNPNRLFLNSDNPNANPWSSIPWDYSTLEKDDSNDLEPEYESEDDYSDTSDSFDDEDEDYDTDCYTPIKESIQHQEISGFNFKNSKNGHERPSSKQNYDPKNSLDFLYYNDPVPVNHKLSLEESISFLQTYYKAIFGIPNESSTEHTSGVGQGTTPISHGTSTTRFPCSVKIEDNKTSEFNHELRSNSKNAAPRVDIEIFKASQNVKGTCELLCLSIQKMIEYKYCHDVIKSKLPKITECAYNGDSTSHYFWPIIHKLLSDDSFDLNYYMPNYHISSVEQLN